MVRTVGKLITGNIAPASVPTESWPALVDTAIQQGLGPMLEDAVRRTHSAHLLPVAEQMKLRLHRAQVAAANNLAQTVVLDWSRRFAAAQILAIWIKGAALALTAYPEPSLRPMTDVDLLIMATDVSAAVQAVEAQSGAKSVHLPHGLDRHAVVDAGPGGLVRMELHWSLIDLPDLNSSEDTAWFLRQRTVYRWRDTDLLVLQPEAHLLYLCAHAEILHGAADFRLLRYFDLHRLVTTTPDLRWATVVEKAVEFGWTYAVQRALEISQSFFATPLPQGLLDELRLRRPAHEDITRVTRHQDASERGQKLLNRFAGLSWSAKARLAVGLAFPAPIYMRRRYQLKADWQVPFAYLYRWADVAGAIGKTVAKRLKAGRQP